MKLTSTFMFGLSALITTVHGSQPLVPMDNCGECNDRYHFCVKNGHTNGQEGCKTTCREHVCFQTPKCRGCGGDLGMCPEYTRFVNYMPKGKGTV